ncbi:hypothetical protein D3C87_2151110 [compost metagenome]
MMLFQTANENDETPAATLAKPAKVERIVRYQRCPESLSDTGLDVPGAKRSPSDLEGELSPLI